MGYGFIKRAPLMLQCLVLSFYHADHSRSLHSLY